MTLTADPLVAAVDDPVSVLDDQTVELVRRCLHQIPEYNRAALWDRLSSLRSALLGGNHWRAEAVLRGTPEGPIRDCLVAIARSLDTPQRTTVVVTERHTYGRQRPDFLGFYRGFSAIAGPVGSWSMNRTGLYYERTDPDAYCQVPTGNRGHEPVLLNYDHASDVTVGCSRGWGLGEDGSLRMVGEWGSWPDAQAMARSVELGQLGISVEVQYRTRWIAHPSPEEWEPRDGVVDLCHRDQAHVEAIAVTPRPAYPAAKITKVW